MSAAVKIPVQSGEKETPHKLSEAEKINLWRFEEFLGCGLDESDAQLFANSSVEVEAARKLHEAGCPPRLIVDILENTSWRDMPPIPMRADHQWGGGW